MTLYVWSSVFLCASPFSLNLHLKTTPMRLACILFLLLILSAETKAGDTPGAYPYTKTTLGYNRITGQPITSLNYTLLYGLYGADSDTAHNLVLVLRKINDNNTYGNKGSLLSLNPETGAVNWEKNISRFDIRFTRDLILYNTDESTTISSKYTSRFIHSTPYEFKLLDYAANKGLTYGGTYIDLTDKKVLWQEKINLETGPLQTRHLNDSTMLIASNGLHLVNMNTGKGWHFKMTTSKQSIGAPVMMGALFGVAGVIVGSALAAASPSDFSGQSYGVSSNMVYDTAAGVVYYSAVKSTVALTMEGKELWEKKLRSPESSKSYMWLQGDKLIQLNLGYVAAGGVPVQQGTPFMASYNKVTGDTAYNRVVGKIGYIRTFNSIGDLTLMKIFHGLFLYNHITGELVRERAFDKKQDTRNPIQITNGHTWYVIGTDSTAHSLQSLSPGSFMGFDTGSVYRLNEDLSTGEQWPLSGLWKMELEQNNLIFLRSGERIAIVSGDQVIAIIPAAGKNCDRR
jgi:hypothetical protein